MNFTSSAIAALAVWLLSSCSCAIYNETYSLGRAMTRGDQAKIERAATGTGFDKVESLNGALSTKIFVIKPLAGEIVFHDSLCPLFSPAFYSPGPQKWYEDNQRKTLECVSGLRHEGLQFTHLMPPQAEKPHALTR